MSDPDGAHSDQTEILVSNGIGDPGDRNCPRGRITSYATEMSEVK